MQLHRPQTVNSDRGNSTGIHPRDRDVQNQLKADGWNVIVVWECELSRKADREERLRRLEREIRESGGKAMNEIIREIEAAQLKAEVPAFETGDTVRVYGKTKDGNRERVQVFEGVVLKKQGGSNRATFTVRKSSNGVGVEKTWPLHSPNVEKIEVVRKGKVRRAKLNYLRDRVGKKAKVKELVK